MPTNTTRSTYLPSRIYSARTAQPATVHQDDQPRDNIYPKVNNTTKKEMVNMEPPSSTNTGALIHICHWHGDLYNLNFPSTPPQKPVNAPGSSLIQNQH